MSKVILCINSGRCGSKYLANVLGTAKNVFASHEPQPTMAGDKLIKLANNHEYSDSYIERRDAKIPAIKKMLSSKRPGTIYAETNHMFIKTFWDVAVDAFGSDLSVVILRRPMAKVLRSFIRLEYFSKNQESLRWMTSPNAKTAAIQALDADRNLNHMDKCIAYLIDIEARAQRFINQCPHIQICDVYTDELNSLEYAESMLNKLGLEKTELTAEVVGKVVNQRIRKKDQFRKIVTLDECQAGIDSYINRAKQKGISIPERLCL